MRFNFANSCFGSSNNKEQFHKNLFLDELNDKAASYLSFENEKEDEDEFIEEVDNGDEYKSKYFKLNGLSLPLSDTIAEFAHDLSEDKFFLNDLSFVFEISRKRTISPYALILALLYLKRLKVKTSNYSYTSRNFLNSYFINKSRNEQQTEYLSNSELCLVSILLASKYLIDEGEDDEIYNNEWAKAADLSANKINQLEKIFLKKMEWELYVSSDEFWNFTNELTEKITRKKVKMQFGNCTYSDLDALLSYSKDFSLISIKNSIKLLLKIMFVCSSTLLYITLSSYLLSTSLFLIKTRLLDQQLELTRLDNNLKETNFFNYSNGNNFEMESNQTNVNRINNLNGLFVDEVKCELQKKKLSHLCSSNKCNLTRIFNNLEKNENFLIKNKNLFLHRHFYLFKKGFEFVL